MKKVFYLSTCDTCKRILGKLSLPEDVVLQDIKKTHISENALDFLHKKTKSYEILLNKRAQKYKAEGLKDENLSEDEIKSYILSHYTFLKRPIFIYDDKIFVGNDKQTVDALISFFNE
ncbi:arsenate reductase family protein [Psychroflexus aestuariivivens]|uniref:arsenate reductase family protein n=1 Tax=Psychroflexus aestuariivivens TaxID=1795040 RepID=UPI000FDBAF85|nr:ArsC/Spx/MgsR family protein [Psychroflexus aestuariivivens]